MHVETEWLYIFCIIDLYWLSIFILKLDLVILFTCSLFFPAWCIHDYLVCTETIRSTSSMDVIHEHRRSLSETPSAAISHFEFRRTTSIFVERKSYWVCDLHDLKDVWTDSELSGPVELILCIFLCITGTEVFMLHASCAWVSER